MAEPAADRMSKLEAEQAAEKDRLAAEMAKERAEARAKAAAEAEAHRAELLKKVRPAATRLREAAEEVAALADEVGPCPLDPEDVVPLRTALRGLRAAGRRLRWSLRI